MASSNQRLGVDLNLAICVNLDQREWEIILG
jgi:hypothetical protein